MEDHPQPHSEVLLEEQELAEESENQTARLHNIGNKLLRYRSRLAVIGASAVAMFGAGTLASEAPVYANQGSEVAITVPAPANVSPTLSPNSTISLSFNQPTLGVNNNQVANKNCSEIMDFPLGYYMGEACSNDIEYKLWESNPSGFDYAVIFVDGIYKCGWVKAGVLDTIPATSTTEGAAYCISSARSLTRIPYKFIYKLNCQPGACMDGRRDPLNPFSSRKLYANFASNTQSVMNIFPDNNSGFSDYIGQPSSYIYYRGTIVYGSAAGNAIDVRSSSTGWGFMSDDSDLNVPSS